MVMCGVDHDAPVMGSAGTGPIGRGNQQDDRVVGWVSLVREEVRPGRKKEGVLVWCFFSFFSSVAGEAVLGCIG